MIVIGMGLVFAGYWASLWGYCLIRGYDVTFTQMARPQWPGAAAEKTGASGKGGTTQAPGTSTAGGRG